MTDLLAAQLATVFGVGRAPYIPGTVASAVALPLAWLIGHYLGPFILAGASVLVFLAGIWASALYAEATENPDPGECVIDEVAGQWLACAFAPLSLTGFALAFLFFRVFDMTKLWPVSRAEKLPGGLGIMADDMVAGLIAGCIVAVLSNAGLF